MIQESPIARARTLLYTPGHRADRFTKAADSEADVMVLDLEDSVAPAMKAVARNNVRRWLAEGNEGAVRINSMSSPWYEDDLVALADHPCPIILPKSASAEQLTDILARLPSTHGIIPLIETASGILSARTILAMPGVIRAIFGSADLARELEIDPSDRDAMLRARSEIVLASAACGIAAPIDGVTSAVNDERKITDDVQHAVTLGFTGKSCLHPRQVPVVHAALAPSPENLKWAEEILATASDASAHTLRGEVIAKPVIERARKVIARAHGNVAAGAG